MLFSVIFKNKLPSVPHCPAYGSQSWWADC